MERPVGDKGKPKRDREDNEEHLLEGASDTHLIVQNNVQQ
jgi:hypothetical protein